MIPAKRRFDVVRFMVVVVVCVLFPPWPDAVGDVTNEDVSEFVHEHVALAENILHSTSCIAGLRAKSCQQRLEKLVDRVLNFHQLTLVATRGLKLEEPTEKFAVRFRAMLVQQWKSYLTGEPHVGLSVLAVTDQSARLQVTRGTSVSVLEFAIIHDGRRFWIQDITYNGPSLANTYRPQFARSLAQDGWVGLLRKVSQAAER
ncbi:MAG: hypothetical protein HUU55_01050 [Myxococcales bacterium]|nr:hypothetical protein [Myxococcales bacterium]